MKLILIPPSDFQMGSTRKQSDELLAEYPEVDRNQFSDELPLHSVKIPRAFYIADTEVTVRQFRSFVEAAKYKTDAENGEGDAKTGHSWRQPGFPPEFPQTDNHPVVMVSWNDAKAFCNWLSDSETATYRLPTEAEWEHACRAGTTTRYFSGDDPETLVRFGNVPDATAQKHFGDWTRAIRGDDHFIFTAPVANFNANSFGLHDMHGNVWEWCRDQRTAYTDTPRAMDPNELIPSEDKRVLRGGSWDIKPVFARSAYRRSAAPNHADFSTGFRVMKELSQ